MKIYSKKGDAGFTSTLSGEIISKNSALLDLQGSIDEINCHIGYLLSICYERMMGKRIKHVEDMLKSIQFVLFKIGTDISSNFNQNLVAEEEIASLENEIDLMISYTGELKDFIYYEGSPASTYCQITRAVTRRAERIFSGFLSRDVIPNDFKYINRLSDYFFTLARYINHLEEIDDEIIEFK